MSLIVYEHPLSPYAQKGQIALDEKAVAYETRMPLRSEAVSADKEFLKANRGARFRADRWRCDHFRFDDLFSNISKTNGRSPPFYRAILPRAPGARTIEEVMDTHFEADQLGPG